MEIDITTEHVDRLKAVYEKHTEAKRNDDIGEIVKYQNFMVANYKLLIDTIESLQRQLETPCECERKGTIGVLHPHKELKDDE